MKTRALFLAALCAAAPALFAQDEKKAPAGAEMPDPKHEEHEALKALVGTWECVTKMEAMPGVPGMEEPTESKATEHAELICGGLWLKSIVDGTFNGKPFQGVWIAGYDPFEKRYVGIWAGSEEPEECGAALFEGSYDPETKTWTWSGDTPQGVMRSTYVLKDRDHSIETCYIRTPDGKETKCMEITRTRSKAPVAVEATAETPAGLTEQQERLLKDVGDWKATVKYTAPDQTPAQDEATERVTAICNGRWTWSDFQGEFQGTPYEGHALVGFDTKEQKYVSFWFDSASPMYMRTLGVFDEAKRAWTFEGTGVDPRGKPMTVREVLTWKGDDTRVLQTEFDCEGQTSEMEITYRRKSKH